MYWFQMTTRKLNWDTRFSPYIPYLTILHASLTFNGVGLICKKETALKTVKDKYNAARYCQKRTTPH